MSDIYEKYHHVNQAFLSEAYNESFIIFYIEEFKRSYSNHGHLVVFMIMFRNT